MKVRESVDQSKIIRILSLILLIFLLVGCMEKKKNGKEETSSLTVDKEVVEGEITHIDKEMNETFENADEMEKNFQELDSLTSKKDELDEIDEELEELEQLLLEN